MSRRILVVGAGLSGATIARRLAEAGGRRIRVIDARRHVAGNCHTERDTATGVLLHAYGPHIFNTDDERVWAWACRFAELRPFANRVRAVTASGVFPIPINLRTLNAFFGRRMNASEARQFVAALGDRTIVEPRNFEEAALRAVGADLYAAFYRGYTTKQWGRPPTEVPASVFQRVPVRWDENDVYYSTRFQAIPVDGYTAMVAAMLDHPGIETCLGETFERGGAGEFGHVFYTGAIDAYFRHAAGRLAYRTLDFTRIEAEGDYQGNAVLNYTDAAVPWTRIHEHKHFAPWETHRLTVALREVPREAGAGDIPYYPVRGMEDRVRLEAYRTLAQAEGRVTFAGRLATYRYLDMDDVIAEALEVADGFLRAQAEGIRPPLWAGTDA